MLLTRVEAVSPRGETLTLPLNDISAGFVVKDIDGLDPVKATISSSTFAQLDGTQYQSARRENRNITMKLGLEPDYGTSSVRELRSHLYGFFMPKMPVTLKFYMDDVYFVSIPGRVESLETPLFTHNPEVNISILCFDPDFIATSTVTESGLSVASTINGGQIIAYPGSVETGFLFQMPIPRSITEVILWSQVPGGDFQILEFNAILSAGDILEISTVSGAKRATVIRGGSPVSVLYGVSTSASWINLFPGDNTIRVQVEGAAIPYTISYVARYGGL